MSTARPRFTKVICSFESGLLNDSLAAEIGKQEFDALRLVYDVGSAASMQKIAKFISKISELAPKSGRAPSIMIDIASRTRGVVGGIEDPEDVSYGDILKITPLGGDGDITIETDHWTTLFAPEAMIYFGYGAVVLKTLSVGKKEIEAEVVQGGSILPHMDIHVPATRPESSLNEVSKAELLGIVKAGVDYLVVPGFITQQELADFRKMCADEGVTAPWIIMKISSEKIYKKLADLLPDVHGVLISRLEMALFVDPAMVPILTKEIIQLCSDKSKVVFTASEMLGSMRHNPTPTRAEVSDVANGVSDGADGLVLSEEVAYGSHLMRALQLMVKIIEDVETKGTLDYNWKHHQPTVENEMDAVAFTSYTTANRLPIKGIVCLTKEGNTAVKLASYRMNKPIIAVTFAKDVLRKMSLVRGVEGVLLDTDPVIDQVLPVVNELLIKKSGLKAGDKILLVTITLSPLGKQASNLLTIQTLS